MVDALRAGPVARADLAEAIESDHAERIAAVLVAEGLAEWDGSVLRLPR
jgi:hypothetical protein